MVTAILSLICTFIIAIISILLIVISFTIILANQLWAIMFPIIQNLVDKA